MGICCVCGCKCDVDAPAGTKYFICSLPDSAHVHEREFRTRVLNEMSFAKGGGVVVSSESGK